MDTHFFWKLYIFLGILVQLSIAALSDFDLLVFAQQWPKSTCIKSRKPPSQCILPRNDDWTIHGIWPTKSGQRGPESCRADLPFRAQEVQSIRSRLLIQWLNVLNNNPVRFWKHEWEKHGTCSVDLADLNTQLKYFSKALEWNNRYKIGSILGIDRITPGKNYAIKDILTALNQGLRESSQVTCIKDAANKQYLHEVRICIDKNLKLISCRGHLAFETNCDSRTNVEYPSR
ncbi:ribonuclease Oy-like [Leptopilina boulardi]|uniref:ribonuclease Oy-like n=1 Tax=Leptopilina boulardi TaxID=63433 RepID=UPI0021F5781B|nr:ribonuclease Oy-like [Leptopilina boulardi]